MMLLSGQALLHIGPNPEHLQEIAMEIGKGYTIKALEVHRLEAITDVRVLECSTGEVGTTFRLEDDFSRTNEIR